MQELIQKCIGENARIALDQSEYQDRYNALVERFETAKAHFDEVSELVSSKKARLKLVEAFVSELAKHDGLVVEFDERLWFSLVDFATVGADREMRFTFKDGSVI